MTCCQRQSRVYLIITNFMFFVVGCGLLAFGMMGTQIKFRDAILLPVNILKMITILGIILVFTALIGILGSFYRERKKLHVLYTSFVLIAFFYQVSIAVLVYEQAAHASSWLSETWNEASNTYKVYAETKFNCCGYSHAMDRPIATSTCLINQPMSSAPPCAEPIINYTQTQLSHIYIALFVSLAVEILALCNALTLFCNMNNKLEPEPKFHLENASANTLVGSGDLKKHIPQY